MEKAYQFIVGPGFGFGVQKGETGGRESFHFGVDIGDFECDMVHSFSFFIDEPGDDAVGSLALEQFYLCLAALEEGGCNFFAVDIFRFIAWGIQQFFEQGDGYGKISYGDTYVFDLLHAEIFLKIRR
jgi:hypothetical protein